MRSSTFPIDTSYTPVPDTVLGSILESIEDVAELKCILRALWHINRKKGPLRYVTLTDLATDSVLQHGLGEEAIQQAMLQATQRGVFARSVAVVDGKRTTLYVLNTQADRRALELAISKGLDIAEGTLEEPPAPETPSQRLNIYVLYEENVGMITPLVAEELKDAEREYPGDWIEEAFKIAASQNARNWRYIETILKRWTTEGRQNGESGGHTKAADRERYLKDYLQRRDQLPRG